MSRSTSRPPSRSLPSSLHIGDHWVTDLKGGLSRYQADLGAALTDRGAYVRHLVLGPATDAPVGVTAAGSLSQHLGLRLLQTWRAARHLRDAADVVDVHFAPYAMLPLVTGVFAGRPVVVHFQGPWADEGAVEEDPGLQVRVKRAMERAVYRRGDRFVVLSQAFHEILVERYGVDPTRVQVMPPGIDVARFSPGDAGAARRHLDLPESGPVVVCVRRLVHRMGHDLLLEAWAKVLAGVPDATLVVIGEGPLRESLEQRTVDLGVAASVRFLGAVDDQSLVAAYRAADLSVVPTLALEGYGLIVLESLACGTPVVGTDVGGLGEAVRAWDPHMLVPPEDAVALAAALTELLDGTRSRPSRESCRAYAEDHSWASVADRHLTLYRQVVAGERPTRVTVVDHTGVLGGGEIALARVAEAAVHRSDVDLQVLVGAPGPFLDRLQRHGVLAEQSDFATQAIRRDEVRAGRGTVRAGLRSVGDVARLARRLRHDRPDVVHTNSMKAHLIGGLAGRLAGVPVVWHLRDRVAPDYLPRTAVRVVRAMARILPTVVVANSAATAATVRPRRPAVVIPSPLAPAAAEAARSPRARFVGDGDELHLAMVGRFAPWKGQDVFLRAFAAAFPEGGARATLAGAPLFGEDDYAASLHRLCDSLGIADRVTFAGFVDDVTSLLGDVDVLVHASTIPEPFGLVVVEGMAAGCAVVATNAGGPSEVIQHSYDGYLVPPGDVDDLAAALRELAADPELRRRLGAAAQEQAATYAPDRVLDRMLDVWRSVVVAR